MHPTARTTTAFKRSQELASQPRNARLTYYGATSALAILSTILFVDARYLRPGPFTPSQKLGGLLLIVLALYTTTTLRAAHIHFVKSAAAGCSPIPRFPNDFAGVRYLLETARNIKKNGLLQQRVELFEELGRTFIHETFPDRDATVTTDEWENVKAVLASKFEDWDLPTVRIRSFSPILGKHSIFTTNGAEWQHSRAILRPAFVRDQISDVECFDRHISKLIARIPKDGSAFDLQAMFSMMTTDSISDFMFGQSTDLQGSAPEESFKFGNYFDASMHKIAVRARLGWITMLRSDPELDEYSSFMKSFVAKFVREVRMNTATNSHRENAKKYVFLDELLKSGEPDDVIRDHLLSIFTAGRDTTTSVLSYLFHALAESPDIVSTVQREIEELGVDTPTWEHLRGMRYLNWVLKEALRLNPPVASNQRQAVRDTILPVGGGPDGRSPVFVTKGTNIRYLPWTMHRRKDIFGEDAETFRPSRWETLRVTYEYIPFNAGPRICIGQQFALTEMAMILFRMLQAFKTIERRDDRPPTQKLGVNLSMLYGCWVSVVPA
ncbi:cytochrome P450 [Xylariaceae sp. FL1019]|nr:cytochrome P450 [Xylariaceae sp. FL1019]